MSYFMFDGDNNNLNDYFLLHTFISAKPFTWLLGVALLKFWEN